MKVLPDWNGELDLGSNLELAERQELCGVNGRSGYLLETFDSLRPDGLQMSLNNRL